MLWTRKNYISFGMAVVIALFIIVYTLFIIDYYWANVPFWDAYGINFPIIEGYYSHYLSLSQFWQPHNMHRVVLLRIYYLINTILFQGNQLIKLAINLVFVLFLFAVYAYQLTKIFSYKSSVFWWIFAVASILVFAPQMGQIWLWSLLIIFTFTSLFFSLAIFSMKDTVLYKRQIIMPLIFAVLATLSSFNGLIVWPALVLMSIIYHYPKRYIFLYIFAGLLVILVYVYHLSIPISQSAVVTIYDRVAYFFVFIGSIFGTNLTVAGFIGFVGVILFFYCAFIVLFSAADEKRIQKLYPWLLIGLLGLGSAFLGSIGRVADGGVVQALSDRYIMYSYSFWLGLIIILIVLYQCYIAPLKSTYLDPIRAILIVMCGFLFLMYCKTFLNRPITARLYQDGIKITEIALKNNVYIVNPLLSISQLNPKRIIALQGLEYLKQHRLQMFKYSNEAMLGKNIREFHLVISSHALVGKFTKIRLNNAKLNTCNYSFLKGMSTWGWFVANQDVIDKIFILDKKGKIFGLGLIMLKHPFLHRILTSLSSHKRIYNWRGFVSPILNVEAGQSEPTTLYAYVKFKDSRYLFRIPGKQFLPSGLDCKLSR